MVMLLALVLLVLLLVFVQCIVFAMLGILNIGQLAPVKVCVLLCNFSVREKKKKVLALWREINPNTNCPSILSCGSSVEFEALAK